MTRLELRPFTRSELPAAGELLAARHRAHRAAEPLLPPAYESADAATAAIRDAFDLPHASGAVATRGGRVVGYLVGAPKASPVWGANVWVESAGVAVEEAEDARDLYAHAAARWVDEGRTVHYAVFPAVDTQLADAWFRLAFGLQHVHAIRPAAARSDQPSAGRTGAAVRIRRAERSDIGVLAVLDLALPQHQACAPVFSSGGLPTLAEAIEDWEESIDDPAFATFVAELDGRVVGSAVGCPLSVSSLHTGLARPDDAGFLGFAAVLPDARGGGIGRALGERVLRWCAEAGYPSCVTDWRATNLLSSRTWPRLGFRPTFLRVHRMLGH